MRVYGVCLCVCNKLAYADNSADMVDRLLFNNCYRNHTNKQWPSALEFCSDCSTFPDPSSKLVSLVNVYEDEALLVIFW